MKKIYHKLVRDKIPGIIKEVGEVPKIRILSSKEFKKELLAKILEEAKELSKTEDKKEIINELADVFEILFWIKKEYKISQKEINIFRKIKNQKRGSFKKKLFLIETEK